MSSILPEAVTAALTTLHDAGLEPAPNLEEGQEEPKRERKAREQRNAEHSAAQTLVIYGLELGARLVAALEEQNKPLLALGGGEAVGELAKWEPAFPPELVERGVKALEEIAAKLPAA